VASPSLCVGQRNPSLHPMVAVWLALPLSSCQVLGVLAVSAPPVAPLPVGSIPLCCMLTPPLLRVEHVGTCILVLIVLRPVSHHATVVPGRVFWSLVCLRTFGPLLRLAGGGWPFLSICLGPGFVVILDVHVAPMHIQWGRLHALQLLHSRR
jgi:hypothetical protein